MLKFFKIPKKLLFYKISKNSFKTIFQNSFKKYFGKKP